ncbi:metal ABC transporter substrate-binding protein [Lysinibacillus sp. NPDC097287]|uniref:metal ABC transporter substrate-binding protein n=1 Tax=Lysinibacillus sp. NPDC097287 TaxID=3364144 RepID=UPI0038212703
MRKNLFVLIVILLLLLVGCSQQETLTKGADNNSNHIGKNASDLVIPSKESILEEGYPTNENGQTYGPDMGDLNLGEIGEPTLMLAEGENGTIGYVKKEDLNGPQPKTPKEAVKLNEAKPREIPLYDVDGETVIGKFIIGG